MWNTGIDDAEVLLTFFLPTPNVTESGVNREILETSNEQTIVVENFGVENGYHGLFGDESQHDVENELNHEDKYGSGSEHEVCGDDFETEIEFEDEPSGDMMVILMMSFL